MTARTPPVSPIGDGSSRRDLAIPRRAFQTAAATTRAARQALQGRSIAEAASDVRRLSRSLACAFVATACGWLISGEEARLVGEHDRLDAVAEIELLEDVRDVCFDGRVADVELLADLRVRETARDEAEHVQLAIGQVGQLLRRLSVRDSRELLDHALRDRRREERLAAGDDPDR